MFQKQNEYQPLINISLKKDDENTSNFQMNDISIENHNNFMNLNNSSSNSQNLIINPIDTESNIRL
jgi:hypothetical protein